MGSVGVGQGVIDDVLADLHQLLAPLGHLLELALPALHLAGEQVQLLERGVRLGSHLNSPMVRSLLW